jgi:Tol biopolymer transport system component
MLLLLFAMSACSSASHKTGDYKIALVPSRTGQHGIFLMNADTTGGKLLTPEITAQLRTFSWSPDRKKIAYFAASPQDQDIISKYRTPSHFPLYVMDSGGGGQRRLFPFPVSSFKWSPDSSRLLYISAYEDPERNDPAVVRGTRAPMSAIYLFYLRTGEHQRLTSFGQNCSGDWSPDGSHLALSYGTDKNSDVYNIDLKAKQTRRLIDSPGMNIKPAWSPDGRSIAYISVAASGPAGEPGGVYVIKPDGSGKRRVSDVDAYEADWSPDGGSLLVHTAGDIYLASADGKKFVGLTHGLGRPLDATFTPDGSEVMFRSNHEGEWHLYAVDLQGTKMRRISGRLTASAFCLSPLLSKP